MNPQESQASPIVMERDRLSVAVRKRGRALRDIQQEVEGILEEAPSWDETHARLAQILLRIKGL